MTANGNGSWVGAVRLWCGFAMLGISACQNLICEPVLISNGTTLSGQVKAWREACDAFTEADAEHALGVDDLWSLVWGD